MTPPLRPSDQHPLYASCKNPYGNKRFQGGVGGTRYRMDCHMVLLDSASIHLDKKNGCIVFEGTRIPRDIDERHLTHSERVITPFQNEKVIS